MESLTVSSLPVVEETSLSYLGRWHRLVSTTNWEKGRIMAEWRSDLQAKKTPDLEYSDEAWSRRVGNVTGQHVGRLRRVWERFGGVYEQYLGLYWSHFQAALDWNDAEMWLEGAVQNDWSVGQMRKQRWEALGALPDAKPREEDLTVAELDEDAPFDTADSTGRDGTSTVERVEALDQGETDVDERPDQGDEWDYDPSAEDSAEPKPETVRPFANLPSLPEDLSTAFESFKVAILRHKLSDWQDVLREDVLISLDALKGFALAPAE